MSGASPRRHAPDPAREAARRRDGRFGVQARDEATAVALPEQPAVAPEGPPRTASGRPPIYPPPTDLAQPVTCGKCHGDGTYTYSSGAAGACSRCGGAGQVEGSRKARAERAAYAATTRALFDAARSRSHETYQAALQLREEDPDRFARALASHTAGHPRVLEALDDFRQTALRARGDRLAEHRWLKQWTPPAPGTDTPDGAFGTCKQVSAAYTDHLRRAGYDAEWIQVAGLRRPAPDAHPSWTEIEPAHWQHYLTRIRYPDGRLHYVDWTMRQFSPTASWPSTSDHDRHEQTWDTTYDIPHQALDQYLQERR
ncbi:hypothetical protein [Nocardioides sp. Leaf285]|uniref:hypothetical protein n=1 Tax=Nocardioides sp. Leaf285 TaxID=1736322 RepID=UPI0007039E01|nr:hypothetical protein [Nocardioides sp. Leaf285]KQP63098.1 hypothetical protein ASF47_18985 [Nocardioides sp. Leaf285]